MPPPVPTRILRLLHFVNLDVLLRRAALHAPNHTPSDGLVYRPIHNQQVQANRLAMPVPCGPGGNLHDYVPFYFGPLSVMLLNLKTGRVPGYSEGQDPLIYLVAHAQDIQGLGIPFVFTDGHSLATFTAFFNDLGSLSEVDWEVVEARYWKDTSEDNDRKRRKQAEFLVHRTCPWSAIREVAVSSEARKANVEAVLSRYPSQFQRPVVVRPDWYYY